MLLLTSLSVAFGNLWLLHKFCHVLLNTCIADPTDRVALELGVCCSVVGGRALIHPSLICAAVRVLNRRSNPGVVCSVALTDLVYVIEVASSDHPVLEVTRTGIGRRL